MVSLSNHPAKRGLDCVVSLVERKPRLSRFEYITRFNTFTQIAGIAQSVEQRTENPRVGGSIPSPGILFFNDLFL